MNKQYTKCAYCDNGRVEDSNASKECDICGGIGWHVQEFVKRDDKLIIHDDLDTGCDEIYTEFYICPRCGEDKIIGGFNYCPNCGQAVEVAMGDDL